jgi:hypothetical protein
MGEPLRKLEIDGGDFERNNEDTFNLNDLLHPAQAFSHPADVVNDPDLTLNEKRAILASWASDACAIESVPALRAPPKGGRPVAFDDVMDALRALDARTAETSSRYRRVVWRRRILGRGAARAAMGNLSTNRGTKMWLSEALIGSRKEASRRMP